MVDREYRADSRSRDELIDNLTAEMKRIRDKLNEFKIQIDQTQLVVDREQQRNNDVFTELRTVQDNIETIPRQDIRTKYDEAIEARFRLTTMRGQLEKFVSTREQLEQEQVILRDLLQRMQGVDLIASSSNTTPSCSAESTSLPACSTASNGVSNAASFSR